jgi:hypothetical protein
MMKPSMKAVGLLLLVLLAIPASAQTLVGSVNGKVTDEQGGALPGVTVTLTGKTGSKTTTTEAGGTYRFQAVDPGTYAVQVDMSGFTPKKQDNVVINVGTQATIDFALKVGGRSENITVVGEAPVVDVTSSATNNQLSQDLLFNMPIRQGNAAGTLLNFAPGINSSSAYGGDASSGNGLLIDGVDTRDPESGTAWTFYNYNIVEEVQIVGIGAPAEYGAFTGAIVNTITKSGGNRWAGLFDAIWTKSSLASNNLTKDITTKNPSLGDPAKTTNQTDITTQISGPLIKDKLFMFASAQRYHKRQDPTGPVTVRDEVSPRLNLKLTWQPDASNTIKGHLQYDSYNIIGRAGVSSLVATDDLTNQEDAPEYVWLAQWTHLFGSKTFIDVKYTGWWGFYDLNPKIKASQHSDGASGLISVSQGWFYYADRGRHQVNASLSHFAEKWGKHDLKFGVEIERSKVRDRYGYVNNTYYYDYGGQPYYAYGYGYDGSGRNHRLSAYAQDSWHVGDRLTFNPGLRLDHLTGSAPGTDPVYKVTNVAPRLGFALDVTGDHKTVLKGNYSRYYEGIFFDIYRLALPGYQPRTSWDMSGCPAYGPSGPTTSYQCPLSLRSVASVTDPPKATIDPDIKHPRVDEFSVGLGRAIGNQVRVEVTGIYRKNQNFIGSVYPDARWSPVSVTSTAVPGLPSETLTAYKRASPSSSLGNILITNPDGFQFKDTAGNVLGTIDADRTYKAVMFVLSKGLSHRWRGQLSYVYSRAEGTINNASEGSFAPGSYTAGKFYATPTLAIVNARGPLSNDRPQELKVMLGVQVPVVELAINAYWRTISGQTYAPFQQFGSSTLTFGGYFNSSAARRPFLEPRGSRRLPTENILDLRLEKIFNIGARKDRLAVYADITNVFNKTVITDVLRRVPSTSVSVAPGQNVDVAFGSPGAVNAPRQAILGARWSF